ncbi:hypothetical protein [Microbacterium sp. MPKO10]|uniref:hypothetical protein n=1 Tax=Microbacterium sp. MPKO10 TaxID=2989818 RepID=UPI002235FE0E|nr:hypothetical protein [Microbacterium sp. MPKO10]MCW4459231.1 hypothetical protein [Microbacterium sp. MPKO10]
MGEQAFTGETRSTDRPSVPVRAEIAEIARECGAGLQRRVLVAEELSRELDSAVLTALAEGSGVDRVAADTDLSVDLVDFIGRGGRSWEWFLNRGLYAAGEQSRHHTEESG